MKTSWRKSASVAAALLLASVMLGGGCGGGGSSRTLPASPGEIQPGSRYEGVLSVEEAGGDKVLMRAQYEAVNLETSTKLSPATALFIVEEEHFDEATGTLRAQAASDDSRPTPAYVQGFLKDLWDPAQGGVADEGVDARAFLDFLAEHNMPLDQFFRFFDAVEGSVQDFTNIVALYSKKLGPVDGKEIFGEIEYFCELAHVDLRDYFVKTKAVFGTHEAFCDKLMALGGLGRSNFYNFYIDWYMQQATTPADPFSAFLTSLKNGVVQGDTPDPSKWAKLGLDVLKFGWDVIKDGKPQVSVDGAFTAVLKKDTTALDYGYAKRNQTPILHFKVTDAWFTSWVLIETKFRGAASYAATNPSFGGQYLQNVQFDVESAYAMWSMNLNVSAQVSNVTNSASVENPDPEIDIVARINAGWLFQSFGRSAYFRAKGSEGIWFQRWGEQ